MKKLIFFLIPFLGLSQTPYKYDYIENFDVDWSGNWWTPAATTGYYTNAFVSPTSSAAIYGVGAGNSLYESDWYSFPNLVVDPTFDYHFKFRLGSYRFTSTNTTRGVDVGDYVTIQLSTNGGVTYTSELRITGNNNSYWNYNTNASYVKSANGVLTTIGPSGGGDRTLTNDGYSIIQLNIPSGTSQIAIDIFCRVNASGEEWWMDNFELFKTGGALPIELVSFDGIYHNDKVSLNWVTASEHNCDFYMVEKSLDGYYWSNIGKVNGFGNSTELLKYKLEDYNIKTNQLVYYRLTQYDYDGQFKVYNPISIKIPNKDKIIMYFTNMFGQIINIENHSGFYLIVYTDGTIEKMVR